MKLRTFTAPDMPAAMKMVRDEMGDEAVILSTRTDRAKKLVHITAAFEREPLYNHTDTAESSHKRAQLDQWLESLEEVLRFHNTPVAIIRKLIASAQLMQLDAMLTLQKLAPASRVQIETKVLAQILSDCFPFSNQPLAQRGERLMLVGPPGIGKTLSIAKLATELSLSGVPLDLITCDTKRAGGVEQLAAFTDILGLNLNVAKSHQELGAIIRQFPADHTVLIDTAGCNPYQPEDLLELKVLLTFPNIEPVLALPAGIDCEEAVDMSKCFSMPAVKRLLITRTDTARRFGSILAVADTSRLALSHCASTSRVVEALMPLDAGLLAQMLLQHKKSEG